MTTRSPLRRHARWLLAGMFVLAPLLAPIEASDLPPPLDRLAGETAASAQPPTPPPLTVDIGTPDPCPPTSDPRWQENADDPSLCEIREPACAEHPLQTGTYLALSAQYPDFCETVVLESDSPSMYLACEVLTGVVRQLTVTSAGRECRLISPARCPDQLHRTGLNTCLRVQRRNWSCPAGALPRNQFNSCYQPPAAHAGTHPACGTGAPELVIVTCEEYVGHDFERNPTAAAAACSTFPTGDPHTALQDHPANQHWCRYDASFLDVGCHAAGAVCASLDAYCIKRASRTGGCDVVADTLRCRSLQADYLDPLITVSADDVYRQGCTPCVVLPFESVPADCPDEMLRNPARSSNAASRIRHEWAHTYREDFIEGRGACVVAAHNSGTPMDAACLNRVRCTDPPRGRIAWESSHHSGFAVVNSLITLNILDIPNRTRRVHLFGTSGGRFLRTDSALQYLYSDTSLGDIAVRTWYRTRPGASYGTVAAIVGGPRGGECVARDWPDFRVRVEELWPDNDAAAIDSLFGTDALAWWRALSTAEQQRHTEARGLTFITATMTSAQRDAESDRRANALNQEVGCNVRADVWCRWTPTRPGYYRLTAAGGWYLRVYSGGRTWRSNPQIQALERFLRNDVAPGDGDCPFTHSYQDSERGRDYDCIQEHLVRMGVTPQEIGLDDDPVNGVFTGLIPRGAGQDNEWLYSDLAGENYRCPARDLRVSCGSGAGGVNYTESEPIGILVHEMRVSTVTPSR